MDKYKVSIPVESELEIDYYKPEMIEKESEKLTNIEKKMDLELMSKKQAVMELHGIEDEDKANDLLEEIRKDNEFNAPVIEEDNTFNGEQEES